jgi:hypothetical protein
MSKPIYYLVSVDNDEEYIMAISFEKEILENMIRENPEPNEEYKLVIKENLKIFQVAMSYNDVKQCQEYSIMYINYPGKKYNYTKLYVFSRTKRINDGLDYIIENRIIDVYGWEDKIKETILKDNISDNPILFDTYYEEGIMNV